MNAKIYNLSLRVEKYIFDYYGNKDSEYCYIPILKNAHSWGKELFKRTCNYDLIKDIENKNYIVFLQDPIKRWYSGIGEWFLKNCKGDEYDINPLMLQMIFDAVQLDGHTLPQVEYLMNINLEKTIFFDLADVNFENNLTHFIIKYLNKDFIMPGITESINSSNNSKLKLNIQHQLKNAVEKESFLLDKIKHFYVEDIILRSTCKFYVKK